MQLNITKVVVFTFNNSTDIVYVHTDLPSPFPPEVTGQPLSMHFDAASGQGADYVRQNFGIEPEIVKP